MEHWVGRIYLKCSKTIKTFPHVRLHILFVLQYIIIIQYYLSLLSYSLKNKKITTQQYETFWRIHGPIFKRKSFQLAGITTKVKVIWKRIPFILFFDKYITFWYKHFCLMATFSGFCVQNANIGITFSAILYLYRKWESAFRSHNFWIRTLVNVIHLQIKMNS